MTLKMVNPDDIERFVNNHYGCAGDPVGYIRSSLNIPPQSGLQRDDFMQFYQNFILADASSAFQWDRIHGPQSSTSGFFSNLFYGEDDSAPKGAAAAAPPPPPAARPPVEPLTTARPGVTVVPAFPRGVTEQHLHQDIDQRMAMQQQQRNPWGELPQGPIHCNSATIAPDYQRMRAVPAAPRGNLVRLHPRWSNDLTNMSIVDHQRLPRELIVDDDTLVQLKQTQAYVFNNGVVRDNTPIPRQFVEFHPVDRNQASIHQYMEQRGPQYCRQVVQPQWVNQSITYGKAHGQPRHANGEFASLMHGLSLSSSSTAAKAGSHQSRRAAHVKSKKALEEVMRERKSVY